MQKLFTLDLKFDRDIVVITVVSTLLLVIDRYRLFTTMHAFHDWFPLVVR